jgi:hypothetical protein
MNVDKNIYKWVYCLIKYGDVYLKLFRESDYDDKIFNKASVKTRSALNESKNDPLNEAVKMNLHKISDPYSGYLEMVADPCTMFELTKHGVTYGYIEAPNANLGLEFTETMAGTSNLFINNYRIRSNDIIIYQADDMVHACLEDNFTRFPERVELFTTDNDYKSDTNGEYYEVKRGKSLLYDSYKI